MKFPENRFLLKEFKNDKVAILLYPVNILTHRDCMNNNFEYIDKWIILVGVLKLNRNVYEIQGVTVLFIDGYIV